MKTYTFSAVAVRNLQEGTHFMQTWRGDTRVVIIRNHIEEKDFYNFKVHEDDCELMPKGIKREDLNARAEEFNATHILTVFTTRVPVYLRHKELKDAGTAN